MEHGRECFHCKQWVAVGEPHDCWSTTEAVLTRDLHEDLQDAYDRLREAALDSGEQRVYASHHSIMFSRRTCYCFVRPKRGWLEVCVFLGREVQAPQVRKTSHVSRTKIAHLLRITHRDEVEAPLTDWLREAYEFSGERGAGSGSASATVRRAAQPARPSPPRKRAAKKR